MVSAESFDGVKLILDEAIGLTSQVLNSESDQQRVLVFLTPTGIKLFTLFIFRDNEKWTCDGEGEIASPLTELANRVAELGRDTVDDE